MRFAGSPMVRRPDEAPPPGGTAVVSDRLGSARARLLPMFRGGANAKIGVLSRALAAMRRGDAEAIATVRTLAHQVRGTGASYGLPCVSTAGALVEDSRPEDLDAATVALIRVLRTIRNEETRLPLSVLLVVGDTDLVAPLVHVLSGEIIVLPARDADAARSYLGALSFDCVLVDVSEGRVGRPFLEALGRAPLRGDHSVIALSPHDSEPLRSECLALGAELFVKAPMTPGDIGVAISTTCASIRGTGAARAPSEDGPEKGATTRPMILVLTGDQELADTIRSEESGRYVVVHCADSEAALERADLEPFVLLVLDCEVGPPGGFETLLSLRGRPRYHHTPIVMLTTVGDDEHVEKAFVLGADEYLEKPIEVRALGARAGRLLEREHALARVRNASW